MYREILTLLLLCVLHALPIPSFSIWLPKYLIKLWISRQLPTAYLYWVQWLWNYVAV